MERDDDELSFELLADANQRVTARLLAGLREQLDGDDIVTTFRELSGDNTNCSRAIRRSDRRRGS
jgi:hypothetical protein